MLKYFLGREARPASWGWNVAKTLIQIVAFWSFFLFVLPSGVFALEGALGLHGLRFPSTGSVWCGCVLFALASSLGLTSAAIMAVQGRGTPLPVDTARVLVVSGPYRYVRNPMALAGISQGVAVGIFLGSPAVIVYSLLGAILWNYLARPWEEADLERRFGATYQHYRKSVWCWLPRLRPYRPPQQ